jgi:hypothetical protein
MPILETLHLIGVKLKLVDLEILHGNLGSIKYLNLDELDLCSGEMPRNVTPATLVTKLEYTIEEVTDLHTHIQFYKYMYKKYPSVSRPEGHDFVVGTESDEYVKEVYTKGIIPLYQDIGSQIDTLNDVTKSRIYQSIPVTKEEFGTPLALNFTCASVKVLILTFF